MKAFIRAVFDFLFWVMFSACLVAIISMAGLMGYLIVIGFRANWKFGCVAVGGLLLFSLAVHYGEKLYKWAHGDENKETP